MREDELEQLERGADELGISLSKSQKMMLDIYSAELLAWNRRINLISKSDETRIVARHFLDSLTGLDYLPPQKGPRVIDVGAGAGFPGLPLKIVRPDLILTLLESKRKKVLFLRHIIERLGLTDAEAILGRAERILSELEPFDVILSRGIGRLPRLLRISLPLLKDGGTIIAYKGKAIEAEVAEGRAVLEAAGGGLIEVNSVDVPARQRARCIVLVKKRWPDSAVK